jgi:hypothetical protein
VIIPHAGIRNYSTFEVVIKAITGSCESTLTGAITFTLNNSKGYPEDLTIWSKQDAVICPVPDQQGDPAMVGIRTWRTLNDILGMMVQGMINGSLTNSPVPLSPGRFNDVFIAFPRSALAPDSLMDLTVAAVLEGCPPQEVSDYGNGSFGEELSYIVPEYNLDVDVLADTICSKRPECIELHLECTIGSFDQFHC